MLLTLSYVLTCVSDIILSNNNQTFQRNVSHYGTKLQTLFLKHDACKNLNKTCTLFSRGFTLDKITFFGNIFTIVVYIPCGIFLNNQEIVRPRYQNLVREFSRIINSTRSIAAQRLEQHLDTRQFNNTHCIYTGYAEIAK